MIYPLSLTTAFALVGALLLVLGVMAMLKRDSAQLWLRSLPRSRGWGYALLTVVTVWAFWLIATIDLGEFDNWRSRVMIFIPIAAILAGRYVEEFLAARALGMLILLASEPLLESAFLQPELSRLFLVTLVYVGIVAAMFWIGMPYLLRDAIQWLTRSESRWKTSALATIVYGVLLLACCLTVHHAT